MNGRKKASEGFLRVIWIDDGIRLRLKTGKDCESGGSKSLFPDFLPFLLAHCVLPCVNHWAFSFCCSVFSYALLPHLLFFLFVGAVQCVYGRVALFLYNVPSVMIFSKLEVYFITQGW